MRYSCEQCREEVSVRERGDLSHLERARLAAHLDACPSCRSWSHRYAATIEAASAWAPGLTAQGREAILDRICARCGPPPPRPAPLWRAAAPWLPAAVSVAALVLAVALVLPESEIARRRTAAGDARSAGIPPPAPPARREGPPEEPGAGIARENGATEAGSRARAGRRSVATPPRAARPAPGAGAAAAPPGEVAPSPRPPSLYEEAERALADDRPEAAARLLEELIERAPGSEDAQAARLELGRLYAGPLGDPARAVFHLSRFVAREPEPSARGAARGLLCRLLPAGERTRVCWPGLAALGERE